jgi:hypothetical protein
MPFQNGVGFKHQQTGVELLTATVEQRFQIDDEDGKQEFLDARRAGFATCLALEEAQLMTQDQGSQDPYLAPFSSAASRDRGQQQQGKREMRRTWGRPLGDKKRSIACKPPVVTIDVIFAPYELTVQ